MLRLIMISAILSAVVAILTEIFCSEARAKAFWLGAVSLYFLISSAAFWLFWSDGLEGNVAKQVIVFIVIAMLSFLCAVIVAWVVLTVIENAGTQKREDEEEQSKEDAEEDSVR